MRIELQKIAAAVDEKGKVKLDLSKHALTERQREIIALVKADKTNKDIGEILFISENTVKYHLKAIYEILDIENRLALK